MSIQTFSVKEAAVIFKVKPKTIRAWIAQGKLAASRIGRAYLIPAKEVEKFTNSPAHTAARGNKGMHELISLLRSAKGKGKIDKDDYERDFREETLRTRPGDARVIERTKKPDPNRRERVAAMQGSLIGTGLTMASVDEYRRKELDRLSKLAGRQIP